MARTVELSSDIRISEIPTDPDGKHVWRMKLFRDADCGVCRAVS